jgi:hypothetical protein
MFSLLQLVVSDVVPLLYFLYCPVHLLPFLLRFSFSCFSLLLVVAPTSQPASAPTTAVIVADLVFISNITLINVATTSLNTASQEAIINTTALSMEVAVNDVSYLSAYSYDVALSASVSISFASEKKNHIRSASSAQSTPAVVVIVRTTVPVTGATNTTSLYNQLASALNASVASGQYSTTLQTISATSGATQTLTAVATAVTSSSPTVVAVSPVSADDDSNNDDGVMSGLTTACVVIGVIGVFVSGIIYWYLFFHKPTVSLQKAKEIVDTGEVHNIMMVSR